MVVQHNLTAMNSNRMLGVTTSTQAKSTEKLSSGYKINRAADDAAGLSISEKMRKQIRGLTQASLNAEDGISAVQTAEGALNEVQDMLQRMNELAVKAANGTMSENDRNYIQNEIDALTTEIDRVAETTKFNETYLLKGDKTAAAEYAFSYYDGEATITPNTTLYDKDGNEIKSNEELFELLEAGEEVYDDLANLPVEGVEAEEGATADYDYTEATDATGTAKINLFVSGTGKIDQGDPIDDLLTASTDGVANPTLTNASTVFKASNTQTLANAKQQGATSTGDFKYASAAFKVMKDEDGTLFEITAEDDLTGKEFIDSLNTTNGAMTLKQGYTIVEAATFGEAVTVGAKGNPSSVTIGTGVKLYDEDGTEYDTGDEAALKTYIEGKIAADEEVELYTTEPEAGTPAEEGVDYNYTGSADVAEAQYYDKDGNKISANALADYFETEDGTTITQKKDTTLYDKDGNELTLEDTDIAAALKAEANVGALTLKLHVGADATANNQISVDISAMSSKGLGVEGLKVDGEDDTNALAAIDTIKAAIQKVSTQRSALGAVQNRLEHTIANLDNVVENTTAAESQIRDTDMATEMVKYSNNNILAQAGQAMLAQANQSNQGVLSLLG